MLDGATSTWEWLSLDWFTTTMLTGFTWEHPLYLYLIALIPVIFIVRWAVSWKLLQKMPVSLSRQEIKKSFSTYLRFIPGLLLALSLALMLMAMARPQLTNEKVEQWTEGIDRGGHSPQPGGAVDECVVPQVGGGGCLSWAGFPGADTRLPDPQR